MFYTQPTWRMTTVILCVFTSHSCQPLKLDARKDETAQATPPQERTPHTKQVTEARTIHELPDAVIMTTSSSDSSPGTKHTDPSASNDVPIQPMASIVQRNTSVPTDTDMTEISRTAKRKQPTAAQKDGEITEAKQAKKSATSLTHEGWFAAFTQAVEQIDQDRESEAAWDNMEQLLRTGGKNEFLERSIAWPNDSNSSTQYEYTPLHYVAAKGLIELVKELVEKKNLDADLRTDKKENTPLHTAAAGGHLNVVKYLSKKKNADISKKDNQGASALHYAAAGRDGESNRDVLEYLVEMKKEEGMKCTNDGLSVLELAVHANNVPVVQYWVTTFNKKMMML